ncbi:MAG: response regulator [Lachnospiraceae bacterium]|jgi:Response regulator containing CheY-like receiver, AAA-type ATPase, and DNA-binding domains|nr:response regulator [Lachnospiraceae bacterium]
MKNNRKSILIVDDAKFMREFLTAQLSNEYDIITAKNGKEGVSKYEESEPDVVLLDINMPKLHGVDALQRILKINNQAKVIMLSVEDSYEVIEDCKKYGAIDYIIKPFSMDNLYQSLHIALYDV